MSVTTWNTSDQTIEVRSGSAIADIVDSTLFLKFLKTTPRRRDTEGKRDCVGLVGEAMWHDGCKRFFVTCENCTVAAWYW